MYLLLLFFSNWWYNNCSSGEIMDLIRKIVNITSQIYDLYLELYQMEINGKESSSGYFSSIHQLKGKICEEKSLYSVFNKDRKDYSELFAYAECFGEDIFLRVYSQVLASKHISPMDDFEIGNYQEQSVRDYQLKCFRDADIFLMQFFFMQTYIESAEICSLRDELIHVKYYSSFINPVLGMSLVDMNFQIPSTLYTSFNFLTDLLQIDCTESSKYLLEGCLEAAVEAMARLFRIRDMDYKTMSDNPSDSWMISKRVEVVISECMLRAAICLMDDCQYGMIYHSLEATINSQVKPFNQMSIDSIRSILATRKEDRTHIRTISMKK